MAPVLREMMEIGKEKVAARRKVSFLTCLLFSATKIIFRRAGYLSLPKCLMVLSRPHKVSGSVSLRGEGGCSFRRGKK